MLPLIAVEINMLKDAFLVSENRFELMQTSPDKELVPSFYFKAKDSKSRDEWFSALQTCLMSAESEGPDAASDKSTLRVRAHTTQKPGVRESSQKENWLDGVESEDESAPLSIVRRSTGDLNPHRMDSSRLSLASSVCKTRELLIKSSSSRDLISAGEVGTQSRLRSNSLGSTDNLDLKDLKEWNTKLIAGSQFQKRV